MPRSAWHGAGQRAIARKEENAICTLETKPPIGAPQQKRGQATFLTVWHGCSWSFPCDEKSSLSPFSFGGRWDPFARSV